jgi:hypothetical protein
MSLSSRGVATAAPQTTAPAADELEMFSWPRIEKGIDHEDSEHPARLITRVLPASAAAPAMARETFASLADALTSELVRDAQLLVSELVTHRVRLVREGTLLLDVSMTGGGVRVQVTGDERGSARPPVDSGEPALGWELQIVAEIADRWGIRQNGLTTIWFELDR